MRNLALAAGLLAASVEAFSPSSSGLATPAGLRLPKDKLQSVHRPSASRSTCAAPSMKAGDQSVASKVAGFAAGMAILLSPVTQAIADVDPSLPAPSPPSSSQPSGDLTFQWKGAKLTVTENPSEAKIFPSKPTCSSQHWSATLLSTVEDTGGGFADLPPCLPWSKGPCVSISGQCFADDSLCGKSFKACADNKDCLKGLSCLARCGGDPTCSTGCFASFGDDTITGFMSCILEDKECLSFPKDPKLLGWLDDGDAAPKKMANFDMKSLKGDWIKVYGLDSRYDCFECQQNRFYTDKEGGWRMDTTFRLPRPRGLSKTSVEPPLQPNTFSWPKDTKVPDVAYFQNDLTEEVLVDKESAKPSMHTTGRTFGLTFWENYYIVGQGDDFQFIRYIGHTVQGGYKGAFVVARGQTLSPESIDKVKAIAKEQGLDWKEFCKIKNDACSVKEEGAKGSDVGEFVGDANKYVKFMFDRQEKVSK